MEYDTFTAAKKFHVCRQTILKMIYANKIEAKKLGRKWQVEDESIKNYIECRWKRKNRKVDGKLVYDPNLNEISIREASLKFKIPYATIYYYIRKSRLSFKRVGGVLVLNTNDVKKLYNEIKCPEPQL